MLSGGCGIVNEATHGALCLGEVHGIEELSDLLGHAVHILIHAAGVRQRVVSREVRVVLIIDLVRRHVVHYVQEADLRHKGLKAVIKLFTLCALVHHQTQIVCEVVRVSDYLLLVEGRAGLTCLELRD